MLKQERNTMTLIIFLLLLTMFSMLHRLYIIYSYYSLLAGQNFYGKLEKSQLGDCQLDFPSTTNQ